MLDRLLMNGTDDHLHQQRRDENCDVGGWGSSSIKDNNSYKADLYEEDDLGFDPFHETQKALAEMLESESKQVAAHQQQQRQQQQQLYQFASRNDSPPLQNLRHESPVMNRAPGSGNGGLIGLRGFANDMSNHSGRVKQPPPGFDPLSMLNSGTNGQHSTQRNLLSPGELFRSLTFGASNL